jgi:uncharacterized repeat protein (TIGR03803 family)
VLYSFCSASNCTDGAEPDAGLTRDAAGNLYGTTITGGAFGYGTVFKLAPPTTTVTTTTLTSTPNPSAYGQAVTFTATVTSNNGAPPNGEEVTFMNGKSPLGAGSLSGGSANFTTSGLQVGMNSITAVYAGDANFLGSTSNTVSQAVSPATTSTALTSSENPSAYGQAVIFTATVNAEFSGVPTGTVTFYSGGTKLGTTTLSGGVANYKTSALAVGTDLITAAYNAGSSFTGSTSDPLSQVVLKALTKIKLVSSPDPSNYQQAVTFTVTVSPQFSGKVTGTVTFYNGTTSLQTVTLGKDKAKYTTSTLTVGKHTITATYNGSIDFIGISSSLVQTVK